jgi:hypothetical protein
VVNDQELLDEERAIALEVEAKLPDTPRCGAPHPALLHDVTPLHCELLPRHATRHRHWTGGVDVAWH